VDIYIPSSLFTGGSYVVLYATLGGELGPTDDGFEEFAALQGHATSTPDNGATMMLLGVALGATELLRRLLQKRSAAVRCES
jgi:hypothetical protein